MRRKIPNSLLVVCKDVNLTKVRNIEFYIKQGDILLEYYPEVLSLHEMVVKMPFEDAKKLSCGHAELQFAFIDENGTPRASDIEKHHVADLLKEAGYAPI